jgi:short-subunit dehydrogenase
VKRIDYKNRWVLVTGASSGLGAEFARALAHRGANLVLTARSAERLEQLALDLGRVNGVQTRVVVADLGAADGVQSLLGGVAALGVQIEHVISNAGFGSAGRFVDSDEQAETRMVRVNCEAVVAIARHYVPALVRLRSGGILHVASTAAYQPTPYMATYGASKAFVMSFSLALREELAGTGVRVVTLCPGPVPTGFQRVAGVEAPLPRMSILQATEVVETAMDAYDRNSAVVVPGALNSVQTAAVKLLPRAVVSKAARWALRGRADRS